MEIGPNEVCDKRHKILSADIGSRLKHIFTLWSRVSIVTLLCISTFSIPYLSQYLECSPYFPLLTSFFCYTSITNGHLLFVMGALIL